MCVSLCQTDKNRIEYVKVYLKIKQRHDTILSGVHLHYYESSSADPVFSFKVGGGGGGITSRAPSTKSLTDKGPLKGALGGFYDLSLSRATEPKF